MADIGKAPASPSPEPSEQAEPESTGRVGAVALAWLPAGDYEQAVQLWPELADSDRVRGPDGPVPHRQYCKALQQILIEYAEAGLPALTIAPVRVAPFTAWCAERDRRPDSAEARAEYAAQLTARSDPELIAWPPGRNQPCWCGSGRKYKKCCATTSFDGGNLSQ
jgi:hypothetical protein